MAWVRFSETNSVTIPLRSQYQLSEGQFLQYLETWWPKLLQKLSAETPEERAKHLDIVTMLTTRSIPVEQAYDRWRARLKAMYAVNGDLEF